MREEEHRTRGRFQVPLARLIVWIVVAAVIAHLVRQIRPGWASSDATSAILSVAWLAAAVVIATRLALPLIGLVRSPAGARNEGPPGWGSAVWRVLALGILAAYLTVQVETFRLQSAQNGTSLAYAADLMIQTRRQATTSCGLLLLIGLILCMRPPAPRSLPPLNATGRSVVGVILAALLALGLCLSAVPTAYLVMIALEAVSYALRHVVRPAWPPLAERVRDAALPAAVAAAACVATGFWISRDLRAAAGRSPTQLERHSRWGLAARFASVGLMISMSWYLERVTIPYLHIHFKDGIEGVFVPVVAGVIFGGLAGLSAGVVARALGRSEQIAAPPRRRSFAWLGSRTIAILALLQVIGMAVAVIERERGRSHEFHSDLLSTWESASMRFWDRFDTFSLPVLVWVPAACWVVAVVAWQFGPLARDRPGALDVVVASRPLAFRFLGLWAALAALCVCVLPTVAVASLVLYHVRLVGWYGP